MSSLLNRMCKAIIHPGVTRWYNEGGHCPECKLRLESMSKGDVMDVYRESSQQERYRLALIYHELEEKDPALDWIAYVKANGGDFNAL